MSLSFSVSYSFITSSKVSNNVVKLATSNLDATVTYTTLSNQEFSFLSDADGLNQVSYSTVQINKTHPYTVFYYINVGYSRTETDLLPLEDARIAIYSVDGSGNLSANPIVGPMTIADLPVFSATTYSDAFYTAFYGTFGTGTQSAKYAIKIWGDENSSNLYDEMHLYLGTSVTQYPLLNKTFYNISGIVRDNSNNPVSGATVSLQNGIVTATTNSSGQYTLTNVPTGTWNLDVTSSGNKYSTMVHVESGNAENFATVGPNTGTSGSYLQTTAYTYFMTPYKILKYSGNSLTNNSNSAASGSYTIPSSYRIVGVDSLSVLSITGINMTLAANNVLTLAKAS